MLMKKMRKQFIKLLNIHGVSGDEGNVRKYLKPILEHQMDEVTVDHYGNLLGEKKIGSGKGATILLSAHMDTVRNVHVDRQVLENNGVFTSDKGALGADDRGGIAIILEVLRQIEKLSFEGTLKIAFSREEEIGCIGSSQIDPKWYSDVDLAIVVDRRGNRDVVVGTCGQPFASNAVGNFFEEVSKMQDMDWKAVEGGISDALTFSENGINSVNLSAGYENEHTSKEYAIFADMCDTVRLILQALAVVNNFYGAFGDVPKENEWVGAYYGYSYSKYQSSTTKKEVASTKADGALYFDDFIYAEEEDYNGDVVLFESGSDVVIQQGDDEIVLSRKALKSIFNKIGKNL
jgi:putative aminopeptidase FrvX